MKKILLLIIALLCVNNLFAELKWEAVWEQEKQPGTKWMHIARDIQCIEENDCIMYVQKGGFSAALFHTMDRGKTWKKIYDAIELQEQGKIELQQSLSFSYQAKDYLYITYRRMQGLHRSHIKRFRVPDMELLDSLIIQPTEVTDQSHKPLEILFMKDSINGIVAGYFQDIFTTSDGWQTYTKHTWKGYIAFSDWQPIVLDMHNAESPHYFYGVRVLGVWMFAKDHYGYISYAFNPKDSASLSWFNYTTDNGNSWNPIIIGDDFLCIEVFFIDEYYGWVVGRRVLDDGASSTYTDVIYATRDGGNTWFKQYDNDANLTGGNYLKAGLNSVSFSDRKNGIAVGPWSKLLRTSDGGETWNLELIIDSSTFEYDQHWASHIGNVPLIHTGGVGPNSARVFRYTGSTNIREILTNNNIQVNTYPNPFSESVSFEFPTELTGKQISLSIYDMLGNLQAEESFIYSPSMGILQYTPKHNPASGVYFYRLRIGDKEHTGTLIKQ